MTARDEIQRCAACAAELAPMVGAGRPRRCCNVVCRQRLWRRAHRTASAIADEIVIDESWPLPPREPSTPIDEPPPAPRRERRSYSW